jgi:hypothetical protein
MVEMRTLIYKRTHLGDPDSSGTFGIRDCMGQVRAWQFDAVIGIGGTGEWARETGIAAKLTWIGIGPHKTHGWRRGPLVTFDHFLDLGPHGPLFSLLAPQLAAHMYGNNVRLVMDSLSDTERLEVSRVLQLAKTAPPSHSARHRRHGDGAKIGCA